MTRLRLTGLALAAVLLVALLPATGASAATKPAKVGLVTFTGAGLSSSGASLKFSWPKAKHAKTYEIFMSTTYAGVLASKKPFKTTKSTSTTIGKLKTNRNYFFMVRGVNGKTKGTRSSRVGRTTLPSAGLSQGTPFTMMTWNLCSEQASCMKPWSWSTRRPQVLDTIATHGPSIMALQESKGLVGSDTVPGYTRAAFYSSKALLVRDDQFRVVGGTAPANLSPGQLRGCSTAEHARYGCVGLGGTRYAVWAELEHVTTGQRIMAVSAHLTPGNNDKAAVLRESETRKLLVGVRAANTGKLPVVYGGDWNSHRNRSSDTPAKVFRASGFRDAFDLARSVSLQHHNSYNAWKSTPVTSVTWGDHVDKVFVRHAESRIDSWANAAPMVGSRYVSPLPSDHNPVLVQVRLG